MTGSGRNEKSAISSKLSSKQIDMLQSAGFGPRKTEIVAALLARFNQLCADNNWPTNPSIESLTALLAKETERRDNPTKAKYAINAFVSLFRCFDEYRAFLLSYDLRDHETEYYSLSATMRSKVEARWWSDRWSAEALQLIVDDLLWLDTGFGSDAERYFPRGWNRKLRKHYLTISVTAGKRKPRLKRLHELAETRRGIAFSELRASLPPLKPEIIDKVETLDVSSQKKAYLLEYGNIFLCWISMMDYPLEIERRTTKKFRRYLVENGIGDDSARQYIQRIINIFATGGYERCDFSESAELPERMQKYIDRKLRSKQVVKRLDTCFRGFLLANEIKEDSPELSINEATVDRYKLWMGKRGIVEGSMQQNLQILRAYCDAEGMDATWHPQSALLANYHPPRSLHLEGRFRTAFLSFERAVRFGRVDEEPSAVRRAETLLFRLQAGAKEIGIEPVLTEEVIDEVFEYWARIGSFGSPHLGDYKTRLRKILGVAYPDHPWSRHSLHLGKRSLESVLSEKHWEPHRDAALTAQSDGLEPGRIKILDPLLQYVNQYGRSPAPGEILPLLDNRRGKLIRARDSLNLLAPEMPILASVNAAVVDLLRGEARERAETSLTLVHSPNAMDRLPPRLRSQMNNAISTHRGNVYPISDHEISRLRSAMKHLGPAWPSQNPRKLTRLVAEQFDQRMELAGLAPATREGYWQSFLVLCRYLDVASHVHEFARHRRTYWEKETRYTPKRKEVFLAETGLTLADMTSFPMACQAEIVAHRRGMSLSSYRFSLLKSLCFALMIVRPFRVSDLRRLTFHVNVFRSSSGWYYDFRDAKRGNRLAGTFPKQLTPYFDNVIALGTRYETQEQFDDLYMLQAGMPVFAGYTGNPLSKNWIWSFVYSAVGYGPHLYRTLLTDHLGLFGSEGAKVLQAVLAHSSPHSREHYEVRAKSILQSVCDQMIVEMMKDL